VPDDRRREQAWIGDAVLSLYARERIVERDHAVDGPKAARMTSNQFLSGAGEPTLVEAEIGRVYEAEGLEAAFAWIEQRLMPLFERQEANRRRKTG